MDVDPPPPAALAAAAPSPTPEGLLAALPGIEASGQWSKLPTVFKLVPLTPEVLQGLLAIARYNSACALASALLNVGIDSVGTLLTAPADIITQSPVKDLPDGAGPLFLGLIAALRDKASPRGAFFRAFPRRAKLTLLDKLLPPVPSSPCISTRWRPSSRSRG